MSAQPERDPCYLSKGERALILRALNFFIHEQGVLITEAYAKYAAKQRVVFEDHKQHHQKQIGAAGALKERFRRNDVLRSSITQTEKEKS